MKKIIPLLIALGAILFLWIFFSKEEPLTGEFYKTPLPEKFLKSSYYSKYNLENKFVIYVDFARSRKKRRLWVVDKGEVIATSYTSHGKKSAAFTNLLVPRSFSNKIGSNQSSLGIYRIYPERRMNPGKIHSCTCQKYLQEKKCAHNARKFPINGLEESNSNALDRGVVIHTARYVSEKGCTENSEGCFVVSPEIFELLQGQNKGMFTFSTKQYYLLALR